MTRAADTRGPLYQSRFVQSADVQLFMLEAGDPNKPSILFLHGYPDTHEVWSKQMAALAGDYHVIAFDIRGMGKSSAPATIQGAYRFAHLIDDIHAVIDASCGKGGKVHLVGHDWGSVIAWQFVLHPQHSRRLLSWTSISGPDLRLMQYNMWGAWKTLKIANIVGSLSQLMRSYYVYTMFIPKFWELVFGRFGRPQAFNRMLTGAGVPADDLSLVSTRDGAWQRLEHGLNLYRQNVFRWQPRPQKGGCNTPTQLIVLTKDSYIHPICFLDLEQYVKPLTRVELAEKHWAQKSNPAAITQLIGNFVEQHNHIEVYHERGQQ